MALYQVALHRLNDDLRQALPRWREHYERAGEGLLSRSPEWLMERFDVPEGEVRGRDDLLLFFTSVATAGVVGASPFIVVKWPIRCELGEIVLAQLPFRRAWVPRCDLGLPREEAAHDALFERLASEAKRFDAIHFEDLEVDSWLWRYLHRSPTVQRHFRIFTPEESSKHSLIEMPESFDEYMAKFSSKTRGTLRRKVRRLKKEGEVELTRVSTPEQVGAFVDAATAVSRKSYQYQLLGLGMQDPAGEKRWLGFLAEHGWLRSYLLRLDGAPCAYLIGIQEPTCFWYWDVAQDSDYNRLSVGTALLVMALEDIFAHDRPQRVDFSSGEGEHKVFFGNQHYQGTHLFLAPRRLYPQSALLALLATKRFTKQVSALLDRYELKGKVKRAIRQASVKLGRDSS